MKTNMTNHKLAPPAATSNVRDVEHKQLRERLVRLIAEREAARIAAKRGTAAT
jgi:hypothetical protein